MDSLNTLKVHHFCTIDLVGDNADLNCKVYFEVSYPFWVVDHLRLSKVHHCLLLVTVGSPSNH